jgi:hypothetical protein
MEGHEYFSLRRSVEQIRNRNSLEHLLGMHALIIIDYRLKQNNWSQDFVNNLLENIGKAIELVVSNLCKCEYKNAMKEVCERFAQLQIEDATDKIEYDKLLFLSTRSRRSVAESLRKFELYLNLLSRLKETVPKTYNFYQCAIGCLLSAKSLGFWLDQTL